MIAPKSRLTFLVAALLAVATVVTISCNDESSETNDTIVNPADGADTLKMDTAVTRPPVKTTN